MKKKLAKLLVLLMLTSIFIAGCSKTEGKKSQPPKSDASETSKGTESGDKEKGFSLPNAPSKPALIQFAGGNSSGTFFLIANGVAQILNRDYSEFVKCSTQATSGSVEILKLLNSGDVDFGWSQSGMALQAMEGSEPFNAPHPNIASVVYGYPNVCQIVATLSSGIESVSDLAGRKFGVGGLGAASELNMRDICEAYGLNYTDRKDFTAEYASENDFPDMIANRLIDGGFSASAIGAHSVVSAMSTGNCKLISLSDEAIAKVCKKNPGFFEYTIKAGTYEHQDYDVKTVAVANYIYCRADLDNTSVQVLLDAIFNNLDELSIVHSAVKNISYNTALQGMTIPLHPAAEAYYKAVKVLK